MISQFYVSTISSERQNWAFRDNILKNWLKMTSLEVYLKFQNSNSYSQISLMIHKESSIAGIKNCWFRFTTWNVVSCLAALGFMPHPSKKTFCKKRKEKRHNIAFICLLIFAGTKLKMYAIQSYAYFLNHQAFSLTEFVFNRVKDYSFRGKVNTIDGISSDSEQNQDDFLQSLQMQVENYLWDRNIWGWREKGKGSY